MAVPEKWRDRHPPQGASLPLIQGHTAPSDIEREARKPSLREDSQTYTLARFSNTGADAVTPGARASIVCGDVKLRGTGSYPLSASAGPLRIMGSKQLSQEPRKQAHRPTTPEARGDPRAGPAPCSFSFLLPPLPPRQPPGHCPIHGSLHAPSAPPPALLLSAPPCPPSSPPSYVSLLSLSRSLKPDLPPFIRCMV